MKSSVENEPKANEPGSLDLLRIMSENSCGRVDKQRPEADLSRVSIEAATVHPFSLLRVLVVAAGRRRLHHLVLVHTGVLTCLSHAF